MDRPVDLPDKLFFKIGEVSRIVGTETHVLRYWEREFSIVRPRKSRGGQRLYRRSDVEALVYIKSLLRDEGFTIAGARRRIATERATQRAVSGDAGEPDDPEERVDQLTSELDDLRADRDELRRSNAAIAVRLANAEDTLVALRREVATLLKVLERRR